MKITICTIEQDEDDEAIAHACVFVGEFVKGSELTQKVWEWMKQHVYAYENELNELPDSVDDVGDTEESEHINYDYEARVEEI